MKKYQKETTRGITESNEKQDYESEETSENEWENIKQVVTMVVSQKFDYKEWKKRNDWYDKECQIRWNTKLSLS
jgi:hypothetical protein